MANPAETVEKITLTRSGDFNVLKPVEVEALARAARDEQEAAIYVVAAFTGLRLGELRALRWADVDFVSRRVHVRRNLPTSGTEREPKTGRCGPYHWPISPREHSNHLSRRAHFTADADYVFCSPTGGTIGEVIARKGVLGRPRPSATGTSAPEGEADRFHDLRPHLRDSGRPEVPAERCQGDDGPRERDTTMIYVHHVPRHDNADRLSSLIAENEGVQAVVSA